MSNGYGPCSDGLDGHHIISKQMLRNTTARKFVDKNPHVFIANVCPCHNSQTKAADLPAARAHLLLRRCDLYGMAYMTEMWEDLKSHFKQFPAEWELFRLIARV